MKVFIDTNIWIDLVLERESFFPQAITVLSMIVDNKWNLGISSVSLVTAHFICHNRNKMPVQQIKNKLDSLSDIMEICPVNGDDILDSYGNLWTDFEDGVQYYTAKRWGADCIVTRNPKDFIQSDIRVCTPDEFIQMF